MHAKHMLGVFCIKKALTLRLGTDIYKKIEVDNFKATTTIGSLQAMTSLD